MNDTPRQQRRSPLVVVLDAILGLAAAVQAGPTPGPRVRRAGATDRHGRAGRLLLMAGVLAVIGGTALLITFFVRMPDGVSLLPDAAVPANGPSRSAAPKTAASAAATHSGSASPSQSPTATPTPSPTAPPGNSRGGSSGGPPPAGTVPLNAGYKAVSYAVGLLGYQATVTVTNPGSQTRDGWLLTVTLPRSTLMVSGVTGATAHQDGAVWTFTPDNSTVRIPSGASVRIVYMVRGATLVDAAPRDCRVDGHQCAGVAAG
jgi:hypothetical protein